MGTVTKPEERRIELRWVKDGKGWRQILYPEQVASIVAQLTADGWEPSQAGAAATGARHTPGDYLEKHYLKNGQRVRAGTDAAGFRTWVPV